MRAILTEKQTEQLIVLNSNSATFVPCWSDLEAVTINDTEFDMVGYESHKTLMLTFNLVWVE